MQTSINERINRQLERLKQLERQKKAQDYRDKKRQLAIDRDRQREVGKIFLEHFPEFKQLQPHRTNAENQIEFASLSNFIAALAADTEYVSRLKEMASKRTGIQQGANRARRVSVQCLTSDGRTTNRQNV